MADDHAPAAFSTYGGKLNSTPNLDRIAEEGLRLDRCFCTNAICTPARASVHTGKYSHTTGIKTLNDVIDQTEETTLGMLLHDAGYQTAFVGKWHLGHGGNSDPAGYDYWSVLPVQGRYYDPEMSEMGEPVVERGYVTDVLTDKALSWLEKRETDRPFFLVCAHKAPHDPFQPNRKHMGLFADEPIPEPATFHDDYQNRAAAAGMATEQVALMHLKNHVPDAVPHGLSAEEQKAWNYQSYMRNYLRCVASIDENVGRLLDFLDDDQIAEDTIVIYSSDHGFFLGDHGWYDKRFMYEESLRMPLLIRYPRGVEGGTVNDQMVLNVDFTPTLLEFAGIDVPEHFQGTSFCELLAGQTPDGWQTSMYYRYWMHLAHHHVYAHYGVRTLRYKLIYYYADGLEQPGVIDESKEPEWELFDLDTDPYELNNVYHDPDYAGVVEELTEELHRLQARVADEPYDHPTAAGTWRL